MAVKKLLSGTGMDRMPDMAFRAMSLIFRIRDALLHPDRKLEKFGIKPGDTVVDYGCGPGGYIRKAAELVGPGGMVYAVDLHELAVESVDRLVSARGIANVKTSLIRDYSSGLESGIADLVYSLDVFHMVADPARFLQEIRRIIKKSGRLILEDGHQPRARTRQKVLDSGLWDIAGETPGWLVCGPR